jgi:hypothetical protein
MLLKKETGGCTIAWHGQEYTWKDDGSVIEVPVPLAEELLSIRDAGFSEPGPEPVREPAPAATVTEPAPKAKAPVTEVKPAK